MNSLQLVLMLLVVAVCLELVARQFAVPRPVLLVLGGLALAVTPGLPRVELDPEAVFVVFVPPLLYWAAINSSFRDFRRNLRSITLLAVGLVLATVAAVGIVAHALTPEFTWAAAFVLGAIVAPPDAIAAIATTRGLGIPRTIITLLEGESLVNDAAALVAYRVAVAAAVAGTFSLPSATIGFVFTAAGGIAVGLAVGWVIGLLHVAIAHLVEHASVAENTISLLTPFAVFLPAEALHVSGVLAVVTAGLYLGRGGPRVISAETRLQAQSIWAMATFILESLIFILIGLELPRARAALDEHSLGALLAYCGAVSVTVIVVRVLWVFPGAYLPRLFRRAVLKKDDTYPPWRQVLFVGWAGMRGGDSLVIALSLPFTVGSGAPFPARNLILVLTYGVIGATLLLQGMTVRPVVHLLRLHSDGLEDAEERHARHQMTQAGLAALDRIEQQQATSPDGPRDALSGVGAGFVAAAVKHLRAEYSHLAHRFAPDGAVARAHDDERRATAKRGVREQMLDAERREVIRLRDESVISDGVMRRLQRDLDLEELLLDSKDSASARSLRHISPTPTPEIDET